jgi:hypothetical protein
VSQFEYLLKVVGLLVGSRLPTASRPTRELEKRMSDADDWRLDHTGIGVSNIARSAKFYDAALGALGLCAVVTFTKTFEIADGGNNSDLGGVGYGATYPIFWIDIFHPTE